MKKIFAIAIITSVALVSCKKSSTTPGIGTSGIQATIGNATTVFNILAFATPTNRVNNFNHADTSYSIYATAYAQGSSQPYLSITLVSNKPIASGAVFSDTAAAPWYYYSPITSYTASNLEIDYGYNYDPNNMYSYYGTAGVKSSPSTLTITALSATSISGTFQGTLYIQNDSTGLKQAITNGKFIAPVVN